MALKIRDPLIENHNIKDLVTKLPDRCLSKLATTGEVIMIRFGVMGYYPSPVKDADAYNKQHGITAAQVEAMEAGSMMGWEVPAANPDNYIEYLTGRVLT